MPEQTASYWYADDDARSTSVMEAMRSYRAAEVAMGRRTQQSMEMGENELLVLRFLSRSRLRGSSVTPGAISRYLGITSASTTTLLDRLDGEQHERLGAGMILGASLLTARGIPTTGEYELRTTVAQLTTHVAGAGGSFTEGESHRVVSIPAGFSSS